MSQLITAASWNNTDGFSKHLQQINCRDAEREDNYVALDRSLIIISHKNYGNNWIRPRNTCAHSYPAAYNKYTLWMRLKTE